MAGLMNEQGTITISDDVIANIVGACAEQSYGLVGMAVKSAQEGFAELLNRENYKKGVRVKTVDDALVIDMYVIVEYGISINTAAQSAIDLVKYTVESTTGLKVASVNITVEGVRV